jgi:hypothetical protein
MGDIQILVPVAPSRIDERPLAPRPTTPSALRLGVLDNGKANAGLLLDTVTEALADKVPDLRFEREHKGASEGAPTAVMGRLQRCDAVLLAIAD